MALTILFSPWHQQSDTQRLIAEARRINGQVAAVLMRHGQDILPPAPPGKTIWEHVIEEDVGPVGDAP